MWNNKSSQKLQGTKKPFKINLQIKDILRIKKNLFTKEKIFNYIIMIDGWVFINKIVLTVELFRLNQGLIQEIRISDLGNQDI